MAITAVKVRAKVEVGSITVETPYVQSFSVRKQRGQISTFDASLKVPAGTAATLSGGDVRIYAGEGRTSLIFTGICRSAKISPCYDDPSYVLLSISGADVLSLLQDKKFTRRCRATNSTWCSINGIARGGLKSGSLAHTNDAVINVDDGQLKVTDNTTGYNTNSQSASNTRSANSDSGISRITKAQITIYTTKEDTTEG